MPNYPALATQGIYSDTQTGIRVFAGQRAETFYIDLGAVFDTLNLRRYLPTLTGAGEDLDFVNPFGVNRFSAAKIAPSRSKSQSHALPATASQLRPPIIDGLASGGAKFEPSRCGRSRQAL